VVRRSGGCGCPHPLREPDERVLPHAEELLVDRLLLREELAVHAPTSAWYARCALVDPAAVAGTAVAPRLHEAPRRGRTLERRSATSLMRGNWAHAPCA
jgi:hypothetical protein